MNYFEQWRKTNPGEWIELETKIKDTIVYIDSLNKSKVFSKVEQANNNKLF